MKSEILRQYFSREGETCNQMVQSIRHQIPSFDTDGFTWFLQECLDPLMLNLDGEDSQLAFPMAHAGFNHGIRLAGLNWLADDLKTSIVKQTWSEHYIGILPLLLSQPETVINRTGNLLHRLYSFDTAFPGYWLTAMARVTGNCEDIRQLESSGVICAWVTGLAHYRKAALTELKQIPETIYRKLFGLSASIDITAHHAELKKYRWPGDATVKKINAKVGYIHQRRIGQSELLGGEFAAPPEVFIRDQQIHVEASQTTWVLYSDIYGSILIPCDESQSETGLADKATTGNHPHQASKFWQLLGDMDEFKDISQFSSVAVLGDTVAIASSDTCAIILLSAIPGSSPASA